MLFEELGKPDAVVLLYVGEDGDLLPAFRERELRHHGALERIDEADAEDVIANLGDLRVRRRRRNHRHLVLLCNRRRFERLRRSHFAEECNDFVTGDQLARDRCGFACLGLIILRDEPHVLPEQTAAGVEFIDRHLRSLVRRLAETCGPTAEGRVFPDHNFIGVASPGLFAPGEWNEGDAEQQQESFVHGRRMLGSDSGVFNCQSSEKSQRRPKARKRRGRFRTSLAAPADSTTLGDMSELSVAVIGASKDRRKYGNKAVRAYEENGFRVLPVNLNETTIEGLPTY